MPHRKFTVRQAGLGWAGLASAGLGRAGSEAGQALAGLGSGLGRVGAGGFARRFLGSGPEGSGLGGALAWAGRKCLGSARRGWAAPRRRRCLGRQGPARGWVLWAGLASAGLGQGGFCEGSRDHRVQGAEGQGGLACVLACGANEAYTGRWNHFMIFNKWNPLNNLKTRVSEIY